MTTLKTLSLFAALAAGACRHPAATRDHGHEHEHAESAPSISITRWTPNYELFVHFPPLEPGKSVRYDAHVTRLSDFAPVTTGRFTVRFERAGKPLGAVHAARVTRPGVFTPEGKTPALAGQYQLVMEYVDGSELEIFRGGTVSVSAKRAGTGEQSGGIEFSKEAQWSIPFATAFAGARAMAREIELPATVEPAAGEQLTIAAPTSGRFFHPEGVALASGRRIERDDVLGTLAPNAEGEDLAGLELAAEQARIERRRLEQELARIRPLVAQGLLPEKRRIDLENELLQRDAERKSAERRLARVLSPAAGGGVPIRSARSGVVSEVLVGNGQPVVSGAPLLRLRGSGELWARARFVSQGAFETARAVPTAVRLLDGTRVPLPAEARFLSAEPVIDPASGVATWVAVLPESATTEAPKNDAGAAGPELRVGASVVLIGRAGEPRQALSVPESAVIDINTISYVFVQTGGETFDKRRVEAGARDGDYVEIRAGVRAGERVVSRGGFDVHLATLAGPVESHRH